jgi:DUF4097 and DUF4098 domain-containing protein YvlB
MSRRRNLEIVASLFAATVLLTGCGTGTVSMGSFDRTYEVSGPIRLDLANASGAVSITGGAGKKVHIHGEIRAHGFLFNDPDKQARALSANPPIEQKPDIIRVGKELSRMNGVSIEYTIELPRNAAVTATVASGGQTISDIQGPVKIDSASGSIEVSKVERSVQVNSASGSITAQDLSDDFRANSASGSVNVTNVKGDVRIHAISGSVKISAPGARVEAITTSGSVEVGGAGNDVNASSVSGRVSVQGNPSGNSYWNLKTTSGGVEVAVPPSANFHLSAQAVSGQINAGIPIVIEDQDKHSLRARVGNAGGRVEIHTISGGIRVQPTS